ncbi:MAG: hypothetical protein KDC42_04285 [Ignavibacteriae bacterium]|nr:hypothetical protein [Ignavibacteriota bacterium]
MKKISEDLYNLIKSLSKTEKSYFRKHSKTFGSSERSYIKLFDAVDAQVKKGKGYDEEKLKEALKGEKFLNQLSVAKNFLYNSILRNLVHFILDETDNARLHDMVQGIQVLFDKSLFDQSEKLLSRAKKLAYSTENYHKLYELLQWEKNHLLEKGDENMMEKMDKIYKEEKMVITVLNESTELRIIYGKAASLLMSAGHAREEQTAAQFKELLDAPVMQEPDLLHTFYNKTFFYDIYIGYFSFVRDFKSYYDYILDLENLYESNPAERKRRHTNYVLMIHNQLSGCLYVKEYRKYDEVMKKYKSYVKTRGRMTDYDRMLDVLIRKHQLLYYNALGSYNEGVKFAKPYIFEVEEMKDTYDPRELTFAYYFTALIYFGAGKYKEALEYANMIINEGEPEQRKELYLSAKLISIIMHYELGNTEHLDFLIRSTYRYLVSRKLEYRFEKFLLDFFKRVLNNITQKELMELFDESKYHITKFMDDPYEVSGALYFDYVSWLESKLENKNYGDIVRKKAEKYIKG